MRFFASRSSASSRGSTLIGVVMFTSVMLLLTASLLTLSLSERRFNIRNSMRLEARNASEALAEYGFSQIRQKFETRSSFSLSPTGSDALLLPVASFWNGSNVNTVTSSNPDPTASGYNPAAMELIGGTIQNITTGNSLLFFVDPNDQNNEFDPLKGKWVFRRDVAVIARATVNPSSSIAGGPVQAYSMEKISVRGAPLFAHAIFFNMDMEIFPGPTMNIYGPVHVNGNLYVSSQGSQLNFRGPVTVTGSVFHAWKNTTPSTQGSGSETLGTSPVSFVNKAGALVPLKDSTNIWRDSTMGGSSTGNLTTSSSFRAYASQTWNGNLQTSMHGIQNYTPVAVGAYQEDTTPTDGSDQSVNSGRQIIEPSNWPVSTDPLYSSKVEVEKQKYANDAGIYIKVTPPTTATGSPTIVAFSRTKLSANITKNLTLPTGTLLTYENYSKNATTNTVSTGMYDDRRSRGVNLIEIDVAKLRDAVTQMQLPVASRDATKAITNLETSDWTGIIYVEVAGGPTTNIDGTTNAGTAAANITAVRLINGQGKVPTYGTVNPGLTFATNAPLYVKGNYNADGVIQNTADPTQGSAIKPETGEVPAALAADAITILSSSFNDASSYVTNAPTSASVTEIAAALLMGVTPTNKNGSAKSSGGVHNFPRFLENWSGKDLWIRGSLVGLFESRVATEPWSTAYYGAPNRNWGFNDLFRQGIYPPGTPRVLSYRRVDYTDLNAATYEAMRSSFNW